MLEFASIIALSVLFIHYCTLDGMILSFIHKILWNVSPIIKKPLFDCSVCMVPWWGSVILCITCWRNNSWIDWWSWILILLCAAGINALLSLMIDYDNRDT